MLFKPLPKELLNWEQNNVIQVLLKHLACNTSIGYVRIIF